MDLTANRQLGGKTVLYLLNALIYATSECFLRDRQLKSCIGQKTERSIKRLFTKDDLLKGFILIGCEERAGIYTSMIREKTPLFSVNFDLLKRKATTAAFSSDIRRKKFGSVV